MRPAGRHALATSRDFCGINGKKRALKCVAGTTVRIEGETGLYPAL
jgi:hypothetical protein